VHKEACFPVAVSIVLALGRGVPSRIRMVLRSTAVFLIYNKCLNLFIAAAPSDEHQIPFQKDQLTLPT
jgi:hypothetical protein